MAEKKKQAEKQERVFHKVSELRGEVVILKEGESCEGVYTLKEGRKISEYDTPTLELFKDGKVQLVPMNIVLENKVKAALEKYGEEYHYFKVTNLGGKTARDGKTTYTNWELELAEATETEIQELGEFEASNA